MFCDVIHVFFHINSNVGFERYHALNIIIMGNSCGSHTCTVSQNNNYAIVREELKKKDMLQYA